MLLPSYWALTAVVITTISVFSFLLMSDMYFRLLETNLKTRAQMLGELALPLMQEKEQELLDDLCKKMGRLVDTRFTIVGIDGWVRGDSVKEPKEMEYHGDRLELRRAFEGRIGNQCRYSQTLTQRMMYVAVPLKNVDGRIICAVRASLPMAMIDEKLHVMTARITQVAIAGALLAMIVCIVVVRRITVPLQDMSGVALVYADGDFSNHIAPQSSLELDNLAQSLNKMAEQLSWTLSRLRRQSDEQEAIFSSMEEGVLAVNDSEEILHMNKVAGEILQVEYATVKRVPMSQIVRFAKLQRFIKIVLNSHAPASEDIYLFSPNERHIHVKGVVLKDAGGGGFGALIVMRDITRLRHLETVRSDFVANVSHELKTPITAIKGFVETLLSEDLKHSEDSLRFLEIINQQTNRLDAIINDLLALSRLEQRDGEIIKRDESLYALLENAVSLCELQIKPQSSRVIVDCSDKIIVSVNAALFEQAVVNLITNALKYSESGKTVCVSAEECVDATIIRVTDEGFGIEERHLERLFERFYRVDTARSRKLGGTGLGLSIVKHIVQAHNGIITVSSELGVGSTFVISIPRHS